MSNGALRLVGCRHRLRWARPLAVWDVIADPGEVVHLWAGNGAGKSTFLRAAVGLVPAAWAERSVCRGTAPRFVASGTGVPLGLRSDHFADLVGARIGATTSALDASFGAWDLERARRRTGRQLSHGQQRAVLLAVALAGSPEVVVLDEPTVALDRVRQEVLVHEVERVRSAGAVVLVASHDRWFTEAVGGRVLTLDDALARRAVS